jgi:hypothetical protein
MSTPFMIHCYDKDFQRTGWAGGYEHLELNPSHNLTGFGNFTLAADHPRVYDLMQPGARAVVTYGGNTVDDIIIGGPIRSQSGTGPADTATVTFGFEDDYRVLFQILGWPNPSGDIFHQGYDDVGEDLGDYHRISGPAETVVKAFVAANNARLGLPITIAPDLLRGSDIDIRMRMHPLPERLMPAVDQAGIGIRVRQTSLGPDGGGLVLDVYVPVVRERELTESSGVLTEWSWSTGGPTNTRVIVGGQGEGIDRDFRLKTDAAREAEWGPAAVHEVFRDARDVELGNYALLDKRADETLAEGAPTAGLKLTLAETDTFRYGRTVQVGDKVTASVAPGVSVTDVLRSVRLVHDPDTGLDVTPVVGDSATTDEPDMLVARAIARLAKGLRDLKARG